MIESVQTKYPYFKTAEIPADVYKGEWNKQPIQTWGSSISVWATTRLTEDLAYQFTKVALQDKTDQVAAFPVLKEYDLGTLTVERGIVPLHKGAIKALREAGYQVPKDLLPPEAQ